MSKSLAVLQKSCFQSTFFLVKYAKLCFFEEKMVLIEVLYQI